MTIESSSHWHTVRPWSPRFLLTVREITSVSTTFVLSAASPEDSEAGLASLGIVPGSFSDDENGTDGHASNYSLVSDALGRGLSVNVNGAAWKRVLMRMDEKGDEATLVLYGLMPGRQYDVELGVVFGDGEEVLHSRMVTQPEGPGHSSDDTGNTSIESISSIASVSGAASVPSVSATSIQRSISLDEYAAQLRSQLSQINAERESLSSQLKSARKEANKSDAAKRSEIDALKRTAEKHASTDTRSRQKARALQEAAKQASAAAREAEESTQELEEALPAQRCRLKEIEKQHALALKDWERSKLEAEEALGLDQKRVSDVKSELSALNSKIEKLQMKRDRLANDTLPEYEEHLSRLVREVELVERDANAFEVIDNGPVLFDFSTRTNMQRSPSSRTGDTIVTNSSNLSSPPPSAGRQAPISPFTPNPSLSSRATTFEPSPSLNSRIAPVLQSQQSSNRRQSSNPLPGYNGHTSVQQSESIIGPGSLPPARQTSLPGQAPLSR